MSFTLLIVIIVLAFLFDFINGFHDAANSIATIVSTKVLSPLQAVLWAAFFNFLAYAIFELKIADTIAKTVDTNAINLQVILAGIVAAIIWNLLTWYLGIPSSSSHTLIGGFQVPPLHTPDGESFIPMSFSRLPPSSFWHLFWA